MKPSTPSLKEGRKSARPERIEPSQRKFEVICKVRPLQQFETSEDIAIGESTPTVTIFNHPKNTSKQFTFHRVYGENTRQSAFSHSLADQILHQSRQNGKGCLVLSYGVTNSGKTFTIFGNDEHPGILPALINLLHPAPVRMRAVQIYNDVIYCLRSGRELQWSDVRSIEESQFEEVTRENVETVLTGIVRRRKTDETHSNQTSSRSHAIFMVEWADKHVAIADLAGNEKYGSNSNFNQTVKINENLLVLGQCLNAFKDGDFIPYRRSRLTQVLMEYFKPAYKIYMIAHLNRSGQMFHENVNVLEYAAISTQIRHLQPNLKKNPSIAKSIRKRKIDFEAEPCQPRPDNIETERRENKFVLEKYKSYIMGINAQAEADLDDYFKREDEKDRKFLEELKAHEFVSPTKDREKWLDQMQAESRIKLREIFLEEKRREEMERKEEFGTQVGQSIAKNYQEQAPQLQKKGVDYASSMGTSMKKSCYCSAHRCRHNNANVKAVDCDDPQDSLTTPLKIPSGIESESYLKRLMRNPALMIQSGYRMISSINLMATHMLDTFRGIVGPNGDQDPPRKFTDLKKEIEKVPELIPHSSGKKIVVIGDPLKEIPTTKIVKEEQQQSQPQPSAERAIAQRESSQAVSDVVEIEFRDEAPQLISANSENAIPFDSQESTILARQEEEDTRPQNIFYEKQEEGEPVQMQNINSVSINILVNHINPNPPEESLLLDDFRSEKEPSTNRCSDIDLLRSQSSIKHQLQPVEVIPELQENETTSKAVVLSNPSAKKEPVEPSISKQTALALPSIQFQGKLNETGFKSTQETFLQRTHSHTKTNSVSLRKKSNKHHHCNSNSKRSRPDSKENIKYYKKYVNIVTNSNSPIKTRNQRRNKSNEPKSPHKRLLKNSKK